MPEADIHNSPTQEASANALTAASVQESLSNLQIGDRVLFNDRVQPLTITSLDPIRSGVALLKGPRSGRYLLRQTGDSVYAIPKSGDAIKRREELTSFEVVDSLEVHPGQIFVLDDEVMTRYYVIRDVEKNYQWKDVEYTNVYFRRGEFVDGEKASVSLPIMKGRVFEGELEVSGVEVSLGRRTPYYDSERDEVVYFSGPHGNGIDKRPVEGHSLEVVRWDEFFEEFEGRYSPLGEAHG